MLYSMGGIPNTTYQTILTCTRIAALQPIRTFQKSYERATGQSDDAHEHPHCCPRKTSLWIRMWWFNGHDALKHLIVIWHNLPRAVGSGLGIVDCDAHAAVCARQNVRKPPAVMLYPTGNRALVATRGDRTRWIIPWIVSKRFHPSRWSGLILQRSHWNSWGMLGISPTYDSSDDPQSSRHSLLQCLLEGMIWW